jgi:hypothetical protein
MIIWSRWGILVLPFVGIGVLLGFGLFAAFGFAGNRNSSLTGVFIGIGLILGAAAFYFFEKLVMRVHMDKPYPVMLTQQAVRLPDGTVQPPRQVPAINPETGQAVWMKPSSTFFFVPVRFWPYVLAALGVVVVIVNAAAAATR